MCVWVWVCTRARACACLNHTPCSCSSEGPSSLNHTPSIRRLSLLALPPPSPTTQGPRARARQVSPNLERAPCLPDLDIGEGTPSTAL